MSRWNAYLNTGIKIVDAFDGRIPLSAWLKEFFRQHKQMGSRDRKIVSELVYSYYRLGHSAGSLTTSEKLLCGLFICGKLSPELLAHFKPGWNDNLHLSIQQKETFLLSEGVHWHAQDIFPWQDALSAGINKDAFNQSHLRQPDLFLRIRPRKDVITRNKLNEAGIAFSNVNENCLVLPNSSRVHDILNIDEVAVIQDYNSQRVGEFFQLDTISTPQVWDCCAGSGGKSIMAYDLNEAINLTVSDSRASIIENLRLRFQRAGINGYHSFVADLTGSTGSLPSSRFDCIIADVPCSGSGTWSRTPEQLYFFDEKKISHYSDLQRKIISRVIPALKNNGRLIYITCSVFKKENEEVVEFIRAHFGFEVKAMELLKGYDMKADTLFVAVLEKKTPQL